MNKKDLFPVDGNDENTDTNLDNIEEIIAELVPDDIKINYDIPEEDFDITEDKDENSDIENNDNDIDVSSKTEENIELQDDSVYEPLEPSGEVTDELTEQIEEAIKKVRRLSPEEVLKRRKRRARKKAIMGAWHTFSILRVLLIVAVSIYLSLQGIRLGSEYLGINANSRRVTVIIPDGAGTTQIAEILKENGVINTIEMFKLTSKLKKADGEFIKGEHLVQASMGYNAIFEELTTVQKREEKELTFPEGKNLYEMAVILADAGVIGKVDADTTSEEKEQYIQDFLNVFNKFTNGYTFEKYLKPPTSNQFYAREGFFFPETHKFYVYRENEDLQIVCTKIYDTFDKQFTDEMYAQMALKNYSINDVITLASIIQAEVPTKDEMRKVASVFENRLTNPQGIGRTQPYLESDPTKKYGQEVIRKRTLPSAERDRMIMQYDTYETQGPPPGAICNPGIDAIKAVLDPENTFYYYFAADKYGETRYSTTYEGHLENLKIIAEINAAE